MRSAAIVLLACSGLLLGGGAILGVSTAWGLCKVSYLFWMTDLGVELGGAVVTVAAAVLCLPASWLATIVPYNPRAYALHGTLICLVMATMMMMSSGLQSASELSRAVREPTALNASMLKALARAPGDSNVRQAFDAMQLELKCCGIQSFRDWHRINSKLPPACCGEFVKKCFNVVAGLLKGTRIVASDWVRIVVDRGKPGGLYAPLDGPQIPIHDMCAVTQHPQHGEVCGSPLYFGGCLRPALQELRSFSNSMSVLSYCLILSLAATLFTTAYLLAASVVEQAEGLKPRQLRIACLSGVTPFTSVTSPIALSMPPAASTPARAM